MPRIKIRITQDGIVYADTQGIKGKKCTNYENVIEEIVGAKILEKELTKEYYQSEIEQVVLEERL